MGERAKGEPVPIDDLSYAREVFIHLFQDESPFVNLGYTARHRATAKTVLKRLEEGGKARVINTGETIAEFGRGPADATIARLRHGGYSLYGHYDWDDEKSLMEVLLSISRGSIREGFFQSRPPELIVLTELLPVDTDWEDVNSLVKHLYEGVGGVQIRPRKILTSLASRVLPTSTYRARWTDEKTRLELIVETGYMYKTAEPWEAEELEIESWRRLPIIEMEGKSWVPFGLKANTQSSRLREILNAKEKRIATGELAWNPQAK